MRLLAAKKNLNMILQCIVLMNTLVMDLEMPRNEYWVVLMRSPATWHELRDDDLAGPGGFHEFERGLKQFEILLVISRVGAVDLYPFPGAGHTTGLKRDDVAP